jgi:serine/threonine protein kinase/Flp pilus assembly protein TadD
MSAQRDNIELLLHFVGCDKPFADSDWNHVEPLITPWSLDQLPDDVARFISKLVDERPEFSARVQSHLEAVASDAEVHKTAGSWNVASGKCIEDYEIGPILGRGGFSTVYLGRDKKLDRRVAIKITPAGTRAMAENLEGKKLAMIEHPNIVKIYKVGEHEGKSYMVLEYIDFGSLKGMLNGEPFPDLKEAANLVMRLANVIEFVHKSVKIIHRDLKPDNILLDALDESKDKHYETFSWISQGKLYLFKIADFELAKTLHSDCDLIEGTPSYMAPEQAGGDRSPIGPGADIYSLGAILYEMITGGPPFEGASKTEILANVCSKAPALPSSRRPGLSEDLEAICLKCLQKNVKNRYDRAADLAEDLRRFLASEPVRARRTGPFERISKFVRRHAKSVATVAVVALVFLLSGGVGVWQRLKIHAETTKIRGQQRTDAEKQLALAAQLLARKQWRESIHEAEKVLSFLPSMEHLEDLCKTAEELILEAKMALRLGEIRLRRPEGENRRTDEGADQRYRSAFQEYGIPLDELAIEDAVARIRARRIRAELIAAIDDWVYVRAQPPKDDHVCLTCWTSIVSSSRGRSGWTPEERYVVSTEGRRPQSPPDFNVAPDPKRWHRRLIEIAQKADTDKNRKAMRDALLREDAEGLKKLATPEAVETWSIQSLAMLGQALRGMGETQIAVTFLEKAQSKHDHDFWINVHLASCLELGTPPRLNDALRHYTIAAVANEQHAGVYIDMGRMFSRLGRFAQASRCFKKAAKLQPEKDNCLTYLLLAKALCDEAQAVELFNRAIQLDPSWARPRLELAATLAKMGRAEQGVQVYCETLNILMPLKLFVGTPEVERPVPSWTHNRAGVEEKLTQLRVIADGNGSNASYHCDLGLVLLWKCFWIAETELDEDSRRAKPSEQLIQCADEAIAAFSKAKHVDPTSAQARHGLGVALGWKGAHEEAIRSHRDALCLEPRNPLFHSDLAYEYLWNGEIDPASDHFKEAIRTNPSFADPYIGLANIWLAKGKRVEAIEALRQSLSLVSTHATAPRRDHAIGKLLIACKSAVDQDSSDPAKHREYGQALSLRNSWAEASSSFKIAASLKNNGWAEAFHELGHSYEEMEQWEDAIDAWQRALDLAPDWAEVHFDLGLAYSAMGDEDKAASAFARANRLKPDWVGAHGEQSLALRQLSDRDKALSACLRAVACQPTNLTTHYDLGCLLGEYGRFAEAVIAFEYCGTIISHLPADKSLRDVLSVPWKDAKKECEKLMKQQKQLPQFLKGELRDVDDEEWGMLFDICFSKELYVSVAKRFQEDLMESNGLSESKKELANNARWAAASAAALAGVGVGKEACHLDAKERLRWREFARVWVQEELATKRHTAIAMQVDMVLSGSQGSAALNIKRNALILTQLQKDIKEMQLDRDFAGVRDETALQKLPEAERKDWRRLWADMAILERQLHGR